MLRAIIVDDEDKGRDTLRNLLARFCPEVEVTDTAGSVDTALALIKEHKPDLVFLDIEMPGADGFSLIERAAGCDFEVIFTTAYPQYAVKAFKYSVLDYLLKPINIESLQGAVAKAQKVVQNKKSHHYIPSFGKVALPSMEGLELVDIDDILRCEADVNYTVFHFKSRNKMVISRPLKEVEEALAPYHFFRIHKHHLVNLRHVARYVKGTGGQVVLSDGKAVDVSWRHKNALLERLRNLA